MELDGQDKLIRLQNRRSLTRISESIIAQERSIYLSFFSESLGQDIISRCRRAIRDRNVYKGVSVARTLRFQYCVVISPSPIP